MKNFITSCLVLALIVLTGCASNGPKDRFPSFAERAKATKSIDVVVDVTVLSDITGDDVGINVDKNKKALADAKAAIKKNFVDRGINPNIIFSSNGLLLTKEKDTKYVFSKDWKSLDASFDEPMTEQTDSHWLDQNSIDFLHKLIARAKIEDERKNSEASDSKEKQDEKKNNKKKKSKKKTKEIAKKLTIDDIPGNVKSLNSDLLAVIKVQVGEVSADKTIGTGFLTAALSLALSGGTYIYTAMPISGSQLEIAVFDVKKASVVWHNNRPLQGGSFESVGKNIEFALKDFPSNKVKVASSKKRN